MKFREIANRITGLSCPFFGVSWNPTETERNIARRIISFLEDRRVLYSPYEMELPRHCIESVLEIRRYLTHEIGPIHVGTEIESSLRALRSACRKFLDKMQVEKIEDRHVEPPYSNLNSWLFLSGLGELRGVFGIHVAKIAVAYGIDLENDLATIIPESDDE